MSDKSPTESLVSSSLPSLLDHIVYINLESRPDRNIHLLEEFKKIGVTPPQLERWNAVKTKVGAIGCSLSHIKCLELAKSRQWKQVFICEDDITFLNPSLFMQSLQAFEQSTYRQNVDVLIVCGNNCPPYVKCSEFCIQVRNTQAATGYIVMNHYYDTLIQNFRDGVSLLMKDSENKQQYALDMYWKRLQSKDKWYMLTPVSTTQYANHSDIEYGYRDYTHLMTDVDKPWIFGGKVPSSYITTPESIQSIQSKTEGKETQSNPPSRSPSLLYTHGYTQGPHPPESDTPITSPMSMSTLFYISK